MRNLSFLSNSRPLANFGDKTKIIKQTNNNNKSKKKTVCGRDTPSLNARLRPPQACVTYCLFPRRFEVHVISVRIRTGRARGYAMGEDSADLSHHPCLVLSCAHLTSRRLLPTLGIRNWVTGAGELPFAGSISFMHLK